MSKNDKENEMRAITVEIIKPAGSNCANGGISDHHTTALLTCRDGNIDTADHPDMPVVHVAPGNLPGTIKAIPQNGPGDDVGPMMGGAFITSCDSRFSRECERVLGARFDGAVALHDRFETSAQYRALSV